MNYQFNATQFQPRYGSDGGGLPAGIHKVIISNMEVKPTKEGNGNAFLEITLKAIDGTAQGQTQTDRLNLHNMNPQTVQIAQSQLSAYCVVCGKQGFQDTSELHNIPFQVEIAQQRNNPNYTEVRKLMDINGNEPGKGAGQGQQAAPSAAPAGFAPNGGGFSPPAQSATPAPAGWSQGSQQQTDWSAPNAPAPAQPPQPQQGGWSPGPGTTAPGWGAR